MAQETWLLTGGAGSPRITAAIRETGTRVSVNTIAAHVR